MDTYDASTVSGGELLINRSGAKSNPITLQGPAGAIIKNASGYALHVSNASYWKLTGFTINGAHKAIVLDTASHMLIDTVTVKNIDQEAIHFRNNSHDNVLTNSTVTDTGKVDAVYGEAVYVGTAKSNWASVMGSATTPDVTTKTCISNNALGPRVTAESIDIKEGSTYTSVFGNTFDVGGVSGTNSADSATDMKGHYIYVSGNTVKNSIPTYIAQMYDVNMVAISGSTNITPDAFQTHHITTSPDVSSGLNVYVWSNTANLKSASRPSGYSVGMMYRTDDTTDTTNHYCSNATANSVTSGDGTTNAASTGSCSSMPVTTCPAVLTQ